LTKFVLTPRNPPVASSSYSNTDPSQEDIDKFKLTNINEFIRWNFIKAEYLGCDIECATKKNYKNDSHKDIIQLNQIDLERIFANPELVGGFFPQKWIRHRYMGYTAEKANVKYLIDDCSSAYVTLSRKDRLSTSIMKMKELDDEFLNEIDVISFIESYLSTYGNMVFSFAVFSTGNSPSITTHVVNLLKRMKTETKGKGFLFIMSGSHFSVDEILETVKENGGHKLFNKSNGCVVGFEKLNTDLIQDSKL